MNPTTQSNPDRLKAELQHWIETASRLSPIEARQRVLRTIDFESNGRSLREAQSLRPRWLVASLAAALPLTVLLMLGERQPSVVSPPGKPNLSTLTLRLDTGTHLYMTLSNEGDTE